MLVDYKFSLLRLTKLNGEDWQSPSKAIIHIWKALSGTIATFAISQSSPIPLEEPANGWFFYFFNATCNNSQNGWKGGDVP